MISGSLKPAHLHSSEQSELHSEILSKQNRTEPPPPAATKRAGDKAHYRLLAQHTG